MMIKRTYIIRMIAVYLAAVSLSYSQADDSIPLPDMRPALAERTVGLWRGAERVYTNPVVNQWRLLHTLTSVGIGYLNEHISNAPDSRHGDGEYIFEAGAETYTRYKSSTLWGDAGYSNGKRRNVVWNESADYELIYPYLLADSVGGDMTNEIYRFHGGYADRRGKLAWGAEMSYTALLQYRPVDPRPRNVSGTLDISAGIMGSIYKDYMLGGAFYFRKYKQTNEIEFKSEMGVDKIFHLTGLGQHYERWAGTGLSTYYDGYRYGIGVDLYPADNHGVLFTGKATRFTMTNIISDLNHLPMAKLWHNQLEMTAGWMQSGIHEWGLTCDFSLYRRHGIENIFGDAASSVYPLIGSNPMYADNAIGLDLCGIWIKKFNDTDRLGIILKPGWSRRTEAYIEPYSYTVWNAVKGAATIMGNVSLGKNWDLTGNLEGGFRAPYHSSFNIPAQGIEPGLFETEHGAYLIDSTLSGTLSIEAALTYLFSPRRGLSLGLNWEWSNVRKICSSNQFLINLNFLFI